MDNEECCETCEYFTLMRNMYGYGECDSLGIDGVRQEAWCPDWKPKEESR